VHEFAFKFQGVIFQRAPALARLRAADAPALKATHKAGRRGGESIARKMWCQHLIVSACEPPDGAVASSVCVGVGL